MTLIEIYQTLLRRGMPEHPRLYWIPQAAETYYDTGPHFPSEFARWVSKDHGSSCGAVSEPDARDLLAMHALRWWYTTEHLPWGGEILKRGHVLADESCVWLCRDGKGMVGEGADILEAIVAATAHLDGKQ